MRFTPEPDVLPNRHLGHKRKFLENNGDARLGGVVNTPRALRLPLNQNLTLVLGIRVNTGQHFHEGGFSGTVLANECVQFVGVEIEAHAIKSPNPGKGLPDVLHLQQRRARFGGSDH